MAAKPPAPVKRAMPLGIETLYSAVMPSMFAARADPTGTPISLNRPL